MALRRTSHVIYDTQYHVWAPKYRKQLLVDDIGKRIEELLQEIAQAYDITIEEKDAWPQPKRRFWNDIETLSICATKKGT